MVSVFLLEEERETYAGASELDQWLWLGRSVLSLASYKSITCSVLGSLHN